LLKKVTDHIKKQNLTDATQWLSIKDTAMRMNDVEMSEMAEAKFNEYFDFDSLLTYNKKSTPNKSAGGRKTLKKF